MVLRDHYAILEIEPSANLPEIKKAYRRLAQVYHPDKKPGDPYAATQFAAIKEAYETLTHPGKKELYLQQRWYHQSIGRKTKNDLITPVFVLKQVIELERYVSKLDVFRMDKIGLRDHIATLLDKTTIEKLNSFHEPDVNDKIVSFLINILDLLSLDMIYSLQSNLSMIQTGDATRHVWEQFLINKKRSFQRDKFRIWLVIAIVVIICLLIVLLS
jgi:molecular chaperone DnaJ